MKVRALAALSALVLAVGCSTSEPEPPSPPPAPSSVPVKTLAELWEPELRALDTTACVGQGAGGDTAVSFDCERALREVARVAPLVLSDAERHEITALTQVARDVRVAAGDWLDGGRCVQREVSDIARAECFIAMTTAMNGPHRMLETMKQAGV